MATTALLDDDLEFYADRLPDRFEIIDGQIVESASMSDFADEVATRLNNEVLFYLHSRKIGECSTERLFRIPSPEDPNRNRRPDWSYLSYERWPRDKPRSPRGAARDVVPDAVAEVVSPGDLAEDLLLKVREYLRGGVRLVWVVYPLAQEVHAYWPAANTVRVYAAADDLDAGDVLPDFRTRVGDLFPPVELPPATTA